MNLMKDWYVDQPDKSLSIQISRHADGTYGIGGYLRLYTVTEGGEKGTLISKIHLTGASTPPEVRTGSGSESGSLSGDSSVLEAQELGPNNVHPGAGARALAALESDQESTQGQEAGGANESNQA